MRHDGARAVLERALADAPSHKSSSLLDLPGSAPSACELASLAEDAGRTAIHFDAVSVRYLWLDRQRQTQWASRTATQAAQVAKPIVNVSQR
jgi:hypothetical protein